MFYLWGHSYEFNDNNNWEIIEQFASYVGGRDEEIWYATNIEIYNYVKAYESLEWFMDMSGVYNPSAIPVCIEVNNKQYEVKSGETIRF